MLTHTAIDVDVLNRPGDQGLTFVGKNVNFGVPSMYCQVATHPNVIAFLHNLYCSKSNLTEFITMADKFISKSLDDKSGSNV